MHTTKSDGEPAILHSGFNEIIRGYMWRRPNLWSCWLLHEDPALVYRAILVFHCLDGKKLPSLRHTLYW